MAWRALRRGTEDPAHYDAENRLIAEIAEQYRQRRTDDRRRRGHKHRLRLRREGKMHSRYGRREHRRRKIGPELLLVVLIGLRVMLQARSRIVRLRTKGLDRRRNGRMNHCVLLHRQIGNAGTNGGCDVVREEHRRKKQGQVTHPLESHFIPRVAGRAELAENRRRTNATMLPARDNATSLMNPEQTRLMQIKCPPHPPVPAVDFIARSTGPR